MTDDQSIDVALLYTQLGISLGADQDVMYTLLGDTYENMKRYDKALEAYQKVPATSPLRVNADMEEAVSLQHLGRKDDALAKLKGIVAADPKNYDAIVTLGNCYRANADFANATATYDQAIALVDKPGPGNWRIFYYDGISHERLNQWDMAEKQFRKAIELSPNEFERAQLPRLLDDREEDQPARSPRHGEEGGRAEAQRRLHHRQPRLGLFPARRL